MSDEQPNIEGLRGYVYSTLLELEIHDFMISTKDMVAILAEIDQLRAQLAETKAKLCAQNERIAGFESEADRLTCELIDAKAKLAEAKKDSALLDEADRVGHVSAEFPTIRDELSWVKEQHWPDLDQAMENDK